MAHCPPNFLRKSQKSPIFDQKCSCLITLRSGSTEIQFQPELPDLYIFCQKIGDFGIFSKEFVKYPQKHLVTRQIVTFWPFGPCMSAYKVRTLEFFPALAKLSKYASLVFFLD